MISSCQAQLPVDAQVAETPLPESDPRLRFQISGKPDDLLKSWVLDLERPRLAHLNLVHRCTPDARNWLVDLSPFGSSCSRFVAEQKISDLELGCISEGWLRIRPKDPSLKCRETEKLNAVFWSLRRPAAQSTFVRATFVRADQPNGFLLSPSELAPAGLDVRPFLFTTEGPHDFVRPELREWLSAGSEDAPVAANVSAAKPKDEAEFLDAMNSWIPPRGVTLTPFKRSSKAITANDKRNTFFRITHKHLDPLLASTCEFLDDWVVARQIALQAPDGRPVVSLKCSIELFNQAPSAKGLSILRLPLPIKSRVRGQFPFRSYEDTRSLAALKTLSTSL